MAFGTDRTVKVNLKANVSDYVGKVTTASKATKDFGDATLKTAAKNRDAWSQVGKGALIGGALIGAAVVLAVKSYADFEQKLSTVRAVSGATAGEMDKLSDAAIYAGQATKFSASEAAEAEGELAKLGVSTADILGGALRGSLDLAAAGNLNLADAATYAGQAMKIFNLNGKDVPHIADVLAAGANKSAADVKDLAQALQQGGLVAAQTGLSLEDTAGVLAAFSDNALNGSDAGTSFKTMLQRLNPQSEQAAALMDKLGLRAYDASGEFVGITAYAGKLQTALGKMSSEQRNAALQTLFGSDAVRAANVLYKEGAKGIQTYVDGVNDQGAASRVAAIQMDNLNGDLEQLRGSIETALIQGGSAGSGALRGLVQSATDAVNVFGGLPKPVQQGAVVLGAVASAALLAGGAFLTITPRILAAKAAMETLNITAARTRAALTALGSAGIVVGVAAAADTLGDYIGRANTASVQTDKLTSSLGDFARTGKLAGSGLDLFARKGFFGKITNGADDTSDALQRFADSAYSAFDEGWDARLGRFQDFGAAQGTFRKQAEQLDAAFAQMVQSGNADEAREAYDRFIDAIRKDSGNGPATKAAAAFTKYQGALDATKQTSDAAATATESLGGIVDGVAVSATDAGKAVDDYVKALGDAGLVQLSARDAARGYRQSLDDAAKALKENGRTLDITTQKGRDNQKALDGVASSALTQAQAIYDSTKATKGEAAGQDAYRASLLKSRDGLEKTAIRFGLTKAEAKKFADQILRIPTKVEPKVTIIGAEAFTTTAKRLRDALLGIKNRSVTVDVTTRTANKLASNPKLLTPAAGGYIAGPGTGTSDSIPAMVSDGEYVVKSAAVAKYGKTFFDSVNQMRFASGGLVGAAKQSTAANSGASSYTLNAYGNDSVQATQKALRQWEFRQEGRIR